MKKVNDEQNIKILSEDSITEFSSLRYGLAVLRELQTNLKNVKTIEMVKKKSSEQNEIKLQISDIHSHLKSNCHTST